MNTVLGKPGTLYIVSTPIGNLDDITVRARKTLDKVDFIAAEDTRHSAKLLISMGVNTPLIALHEHNEVIQASVIKEKLIAGRDIALICDAGTPLISDPGYRLVDLIHSCGLPVVPVPGPCSVITALSASGISTAGFEFIGFLPARSSQRRQVLMKLKDVDHTLAIFESPHRIFDSLKDMVEIFGETRQASFCRELTKRYETIIRGPLRDLLASVQRDPDQSRGEIVLVISGADSACRSKQSMDYLELVEGMVDYMPTKTVASLLAKHTGLSRRFFYEMALKSRSETKQE